MPKIKVNDVNLYYEIHGSGQPIVLIAGFATDHAKWMPIVHEFANNYQVIVFDNRGVGQSDCPDYPYTIDMMADDAVALCKSLNINSAHFVGSSMGGSIVQTIAYKYPEFVKTAVICVSTTKFSIKLKLITEAGLISMKAKVPAEIAIKRTLCDIFSVDFLSRDGMVDFLTKLFASDPYPITEQGYAAQMHALLEFDSRSWVNKITKPSLVIYSDEDQLVDIASSKALAAAIPNAASFCFNRVGHAPDVEQPDIFIRVVKEFIKKFD